MADPGAQGDGVEEPLLALPPQDIPVMDELQPADADRRIPIVETLESEPDLPPNWETGDMPVRPGALAQNLPPLPPSLGSISGRASSRSGYTPEGGGDLGALAQDRAGSVRSQRSAGVIND